MAKKIRCTAEDLEQLREDFEKAVQEGKMSDGKFSFSRDFGKLERKATVYFTETAWLKMKSLVEACSKEIAWRGVARRLGDDRYVVDDILCYPQIVTGATVTTDDEEECNWFDSLDDDTLNNLRFQGHSHVNMGVTPSGTDLEFYNNVLQTLSVDDFYIFMIMNKSLSRTVKVYDLKENVLFETSDCDVKVIDDIGILKFAREAMDMVKEKKPATTPTYNYNNYGNNYTPNYNTGYNNLAKKVEQTTLKLEDKEIKREAKPEKKKGKISKQPSAQSSARRWGYDDDYWEDEYIYD